MDVIVSTHSWAQYKGIINGDTLNKKFVELNKLNIFEETYKLILIDYLSTDRLDKLRFQSIDSSRIFNKQCTNTAYCRLGKKLSLKISALCDKYGIILALDIIPGNKHDCITLIDTIKNKLIDTDTKFYESNNRYKHYLLGDTGYFSDENLTFLKELGYDPIVNKNVGNTTDPQKLDDIYQMREKNRTKLNKRCIIENFFCWIKRYPKINNLFEKDIHNYKGLVYLISSFLIINHL